jgi:hypothetical protein
MAFGQSTYREKFGDIESCLNAQVSKLYHLGFRSDIRRSTLSYANNTRDRRIYADLAGVVISIAKDHYRNDSFGFEISNTAYAPDATTIDLCLSTFPWAVFRQTKAVVKIHTLLELRGNISSILTIFHIRFHEVCAFECLAIR